MTVQNCMGDEQVNAAINGKTVVEQSASVVLNLSGRCTTLYGYEPAAPTANAAL
jgi:hypothetical protein